MVNTWTCWFYQFLPFQHNTASWLYLIQHKHRNLGYILPQHHKLVNFFPNAIVNTCRSQMGWIKFHRGVSEYMGFGSPIVPLHQQTPNFPNIVLNDEFHNLTRGPRRFPLRTLGTEPTSNAGTCTVYLEIHQCAHWKSLDICLTNRITFKQTKINRGVLSQPDK